MPVKEHLFKTVVDILEGIVFVGYYFIQDDTPFGLYLVVGKRGFACKLKKKRNRLREVVFQDSRMEDDFLLGGKCVELSAQAIEPGGDIR